MFGVCECWPTLLLFDLSVIRHRVIFEGIFQGGKKCVLAYRKYGNISPDICQIKDYLLRNLDKWSWHLFPERTQKVLNAMWQNCWSFSANMYKIQRGVEKFLIQYLVIWSDLGKWVGPWIFQNQTCFFLLPIPPNMYKIQRGAEKCLIRPRKGDKKKLCSDNFYIKF